MSFTVIPDVNVSLIPNKNHVHSVISYSVDFKASRELWNQPSKAVPGKFHGSREHSKRKFLQYRANFRRSWTWQIFNTVHIFYQSHGLTRAQNNLSSWSCDAIKSWFFSGIAKAVSLIYFRAIFRAHLSAIFLINHFFMLHFLMAQNVNHAFEHTMCILEGSFKWELINDLDEFVYPTEKWYHSKHDKVGFGQFYVMLLYRDNGWVDSISLWRK